MSAVRDNNFFVVHGWMINQLGLSGRELQAYAIIYGFSQADEQKFRGSLQYLADWLGSSRRNVLRWVQALEEKGLLEKTDVYTNGVKTCEYRCITNPQGVVKMSPGCCQNDNGGVVKMSPGCCQNDNGGVVKMSPNNISHNIPDNIPDKKEIGGQAPSAPEKTTRFKPPTVEEVAAYCLERGNHVDAQRFVDYYTANGWKVGKNPMKNWKAAVRTWERGNWRAAVMPQPERSRIKSEADYAAGLQGWG